MTHQEAKRKQILEKIRKLQAKTTAAGCTEAEALAAAEAVGRLLDEYGLTMTDVEIESTECTEEGFETKDGKNSPIRACFDSVGQYCQTIYLCCDLHAEERKRGMRSGHSFFGLPHSVEVSVYLAKVVARAFTTELRRFKSRGYYSVLSPGLKREATKSFQAGMALNICKRLIQMKLAREGAEASSGSELVKATDSVVQAALEKTYPNLDTRSVNLNFGDIAAFSDGDRAGGSVGLHDGIRGGKETRALLGA